jgi:hypothetical protein
LFVLHLKTIPFPSFFVFLFISCCVNNNGIKIPLAFLTHSRLCMVFAWQRVVIVKVGWGFRGEGHDHNKVVINLNLWLILLINTLALVLYGL